MDLQFQFATTTAEREAVYRLRYEVYVEERGAYKDVADHENRLLFDTYDQTGHLLETIFLFCKKMMERCA